LKFNLLNTFSINYVDYDDVKLTPSGLWPPTCLYEWVDGVQEWSFSLIGKLLEDSGSYLRLSVYSIGTDVGLSVYTLFWTDLCCWDFTHLLGFGDFIWWYMFEFMTCILWRCMIYIRCNFWEIFIYMILRFIGDVTSISWIFVLFACFITLIEIGCYSEHEASPCLFSGSINGFFFTKYLLTQSFHSII